MVLLKLIIPLLPQQFAKEHNLFLFIKERHVMFFFIRL